MTMPYGTPNHSRTGKGPAFAAVQSVSAKSESDKNKQMANVTLWRVTSLYFADICVSFRLK